jgi:hypothetical protein
MIPEKWIYSFTLDKEVSADKTEVSKDETGAEIKITKTVKEKKPFVFKLKKPSRKIIEEADIFYAAKVGEYLKAGLLSKNLIAKRLENDGGDLGEETKKEFTEVAGNYYKARLEVETLELEVKEKNLDIDKDKLKAAKENLEDVRYKLTDLEYRRNAIYEQSAESKALNKQIFWYLLNCTYWNKGDEKSDFAPYFEGKNFDEKSDSYDLREEQEIGTEFFNELTSKLAFSISYWFNSSNKATQEDIDKLLSENI